MNEINDNTYQNISLCVSLLKKKVIFSLHYEVRFILKNSEYDIFYLRFLDGWVCGFPKLLFEYKSPHCDVCNGMVHNDLSNELVKAKSERLSLRASLRAKKRTAFTRERTIW